MQFLKHTLETEAEMLESLARGYNHYKQHHTGVGLKEPVAVSDDFVRDERSFQKLGREIREDTKYVRDRLRELAEKAAEKPVGEHVRLLGFRGELMQVIASYRKIERAKESIMRIRKTIKVPLVVSSLLIGTSLFLLSLSDKNIIDRAPSAFLWPLAVVIGTAVYLTYLFIKEILVLVEN